jgi:phosphoribosylglycinamide formyltransferase-1
MKNIVVFASGAGSNAENLANHFKHSIDGCLSHIYTNKGDAYVVERAQKLGIACTVFKKEDFYNSDSIVAKLQAEKTDLIVLAGFLLKVPENLVKAFPQRIINIHPALLPKYGGKGMYGRYVHEAVVANGEKESGITIHYVNEHYDEGNIIFQAKCLINEQDTAEEVAKKVHELEYQYYPRVIEMILKELD